jgi:hypothetical protein
LNIKDIVMAAATLINREDICNYLLGVETDDLSAAKKDTDIMLRCFNLIENEIALEYKPLIFSENITTENGIINFDILSKQILEVIKVEDESENKISYKLFHTYLKTKPENVVLYYSFIPEKKELTSISDYLENEIPQRTMAMGIACEFSLISAMYDEAVMWDKRYKDSLERISSKKVKQVMPARRWI